MEKFSNRGRVKIHVCSERKVSPYILEALQGSTSEQALFHILLLPKRRRLVEQFLTHSFNDSYD